eukprot:Polyplicarium_translucidae@DN2864_c0_g1_i5.p1
MEDALCPLDGRYSEATAGLRTIFSERGLTSQRLKVEYAWLQCMATEVFDSQVLPADSKLLSSRCQREATLEAFARVKRLEAETRHDVKAVEYFIREDLQANWQGPNVDQICELVHIFCTSEDTNNLALGLQLKQALEDVIVPICKSLLAKLEAFAGAWAEVALLARTHGQPASPTTFGKEMANYAHRLRNCVSHLETVKCHGKINGAVGCFNAHHLAFPDIDWPALTRRFVERLGLVYDLYSTQVHSREYVSELCSVLCRMNCHFTDLCVDMWLYISRCDAQRNAHPLAWLHSRGCRDLIGLRQPENAVGSSTMPHKVNPIHFENAEGNLGLANSLLQFLRYFGRSSETECN